LIGRRRCDVRHIKKKRKKKKDIGQKKDLKYNSHLAIKRLILSKGTKLTRTLIIRYDHQSSQTKDAMRESVWCLKVILFFLTSIRNKKLFLSHTQSSFNGRHIIVFLFGQFSVLRFTESMYTLNMILFCLLIQKVYQSHSLMIAFFFTTSIHNSNKKNFCLQSCRRAAPFVFPREFSQPINLLLSIVRLFSIYIYVRSTKKRRKKQWQAACFLRMLCIHFLHLFHIHTHTHKF
jgi:hypothetical protein